MPGTRINSSTTLKIILSKENGPEANVKESLDDFDGARLQFLVFVRERRVRYPRERMHRQVAKHYLEKEIRADPFDTMFPRH